MRRLSGRNWLHQTLLWRGGRGRSDARPCALPGVGAVVLEVVKGGGGPGGDAIVVPLVLPSPGADRTELVLIVLDDAVGGDDLVDEALTWLTFFFFFGGALVDVEALDFCPM